MVASKVLKRIKSKGNRWVFIPRDFLDLGSRNAVDHALSRLCSLGKIRRLTQGIYDNPRISPIVGVVSPDPIQIAEAIARRDNAKIQVAGAYSANLLGLSEQVPAKHLFLTDGKSRIIKISGWSLHFKNVRPSSLVGVGTIAGTIIQALKYIGKDYITPAMIKRLKSVIQDKDKSQLLKHRPKVPGWMQDFINEITKKEI